jgi:hypothetical protein
VDKNKTNRKEARADAFGSHASAVASSSIPATIERALGSSLRAFATIAPYGRGDTVPARG